MPKLRAAQQISLTAAAAVLIAGCGGSTGSPTTSSPSGSPTAAVRPPAKSVSQLTIAKTSPRSRAARARSAHAQFVAFSRAVNLRAQDVPGFTVKPETRQRIRLHNKAFEEGSAYGRCFRFAKQARPLVKLNSAKLASPTTFSRSAGPQFEQISSAVEVAGSLAATRRQLSEGKKSLADPAARRCLARTFDTLGSQNQAIHLHGATMHVTVGNFRMAPLPVAPTTRGTDGGFGFSMTLAVTYRINARGRTFVFPTSLGADVIGFAVGRATVTQTTMALGRAFPPGLEAGTFVALVSRATAAARTYPDVLS